MSLERFHKAQENGILREVETELMNGKKETHWIWFIFPQGPREGTSPTSQYFALSDEEASEYLLDAVLSYRLVIHLGMVAYHLGQGVALEDILGDLDALKFKSSMELFAKAAKVNGQNDLGDLFDRTLALC